jgi:high affinity sulfate transporter 1
MLALFTGAIMVAAGAGNLGFVADLLSKPTILGYMNGLALTIVVGQLPKLLGFSVDADGLVDELRGFLSGVGNGDVVAAAAVMGSACLALILLLQRLLPRIPSVLLVVVGAIVATALLDLGSHGVKLVGTLPQGLPSLTLPSPGWSDLLPLALGGFGIALVALTDTISTASSFAERRGEDIDGDKEMIGIGAANVAAGLFQGFPVSTSGSRTAVAEQSGGKSQLTGLVGAAVIAVMLVALPGLFADLPQPTLGAIVTAAALSLADLPATRRLWQQRRTDFGISMVAFAGVAFIGVLPGIAVAVALSVANVFRKAWWPYHAILGRVPGTAGLHDTSRHPEAQHLPGCVIIRFDAPLIFANARSFRDRVRALSETLPSGGWIIIGAEPITDVDTTACDMLTDLDEVLVRRGQTLVFAEMKSGPRTKLARFGLEKSFLDERFYPTLTTAVDAYRCRSGADWVS